MEGELDGRVPLRRMGDVEVGVARVGAELRGQFAAFVIKHVGDDDLAAAGDDVPRKEAPSPPAPPLISDDLSGQLA